MRQLLLLSLLILASWAAMDYITYQGTVSGANNQIVGVKTDGLTPLTLNEEYIIFSNFFGFLQALGYDSVNNVLYFADEGEYGATFSCARDCYAPERMPLKEEDDVRISTIEIDEKNSKIYWSGNGGSGIGLEVGRADLDGTNEEVLYSLYGPFSTWNVVAMAINPADDIFYIRDIANPQIVEVNWANQTAATLSTSASLHSGHNLVYDDVDQILYWSSISGTTATVYYLDLKQVNPTEEVLTTVTASDSLRSILNLDLDIEKKLLFFTVPTTTELNDLYSCDVSAPPCTPTLVNGDMEEITQLVVDPDESQLVFSRARAIMQLNYAGSVESELIDGQLDIQALDYLDSNLFWLDIDTIETVDFQATQWKILYKFGQALQDGNSIAALTSGIYFVEEQQLKKFSQAENSITDLDVNCVAHLSADKLTEKLYWFNPCDNSLSTCQLPDCSASVETVVSTGVASSVSAVRLDQQGAALYWFDENGVHYHDFSESKVTDLGGAGLASAGVGITSPAAGTVNWISPNLEDPSAGALLFSCQLSDCKPEQLFAFPTTTQVSPDFSFNGAATDSSNQTSYYLFGNLFQVWEQIGTAVPTLFYTHTSQLYDISADGGRVVAAADGEILMWDQGTPSTLAVKANTSPTKLVIFGDNLFYVDKDSRALFQCDSLSNCTSAIQRTLPDLMVGDLAVAGDSLYAVIAAPSSFAAIGFFQIVDGVWSDQYTQVVETSYSFFSYGASFYIEVSGDELIYSEPFAYRLVKGNSVNWSGSSAFANQVEVVSGLDVAEGIVFWSGATAPKVLGKQLTSDAALEASEVFVFSSYGDERLVGGVLVEPLKPASSSTSITSSSEPVPLGKRPWFIALMVVLAALVVVAIIIIVVVVRRRKKASYTAI